MEGHKVTIWWILDGISDSIYWKDNKLLCIVQIGENVRMFKMLGCEHLDPQVVWGPSIGHGWNPVKFSSQNISLDIVKDIPHISNPGVKFEPKSI